LFLDPGITLIDTEFTKTSTRTPAEATIRRTVDEVSQYPHPPNISSPEYSCNDETAILNELMASIWPESVTVGNGIGNGKGNELLHVDGKPKILSDNLCVYFVGEDIGADNGIVERITRYRNGPNQPRASHAIVAPQQLNPPRNK
jgi:hypothetical protein